MRKKTFWPIKSATDYVGFATVGRWMYTMVNVCLASFTLLFSLQSKWCLVPDVNTTRLDGLNKVTIFCGKFKKLSMIIKINRTNATQVDGKRAELFLPTAFNLFRLFLRRHESPAAWLGQLLHFCHLPGDRISMLMPAQRMRLVWNATQIQYQPRYMVCTL